MSTSLIYNVNDRPPFRKMVVFAIQQLLAILAGTVTLPLIIGNGMSQSAALFGAGVGTLIYLFITKFKSPVFLGSSFTYLGSMAAAFAGAATAAMGYVGLIIGAILSGLVYVILSIIVKFTGTNWVGKVFPPVVIGPVVMLIALTLAPNAIANLTQGNVFVDGSAIAHPLVCLACGLVALFTIIACAIYGPKMVRFIPFIFGILAGFALATILTLIGNATGADAIRIVDFSAFKSIKWVPDFSFVIAFRGLKDFGSANSFFKYVLLIVFSYVPLAFAVFAEHIADHKNISLIIGRDLLVEPGLSRTLMGDGVGSMVGAFFGGCPNTTYGESISCVAFSRNASIVTIITTCLLAIGISFFGPLMAVFSSIPSCVVGGISIALYGFIASSGLRMLKGVSFTKLKNIFVVSTILVVGIGGLVINFKYFVLPTIACALIIGLLVNLLVNIPGAKKEDDSLGEDNNENN